MLPALLLIDLQIDFLSDSGRMSVGRDNAARVIAVANRLISFHEKRHWPIVLVCSNYKRYTVVANYLRKYAAMEGSEGSRPDPRLVFSQSPVTFPKSRSSAFANPYFAEYLKQKLVDRVVICGVYAEGSVRATAEDARQAHLDVALVADAIASRQAAQYTWALSQMEQEGMRILTLDEYLQQADVPWFE
jgi:nicotinamidase-related amidase